MANSWSPMKQHTCSQIWGHSGGILIYHVYDQFPADMVWVAVGWIDLN